jgi:alkylation response protein AidB-like acyl-CoA dehydrogenase
VPIAITEEQRALAASVRAWAADRQPWQAAREPGDRTRHSGLLGELGEIGLLAVALPEDLGGAGAELADAVAGLEEAAAALVPGALTSSLLAALLLARAQDTPAAKEWVPRLADTSAQAAVALSPGKATAEPGADGGFVLHGRIGPVLDADDATLLILPARDGEDTRWFAVPPGTAGVRVIPAEAFDPSRPVAFAELDGAELTAGSVLTGLTEAGVADLAVTLAAAEAAGIAGWCLRTATEYAKVREQFGKPVGAFQAVKHLCAEMLCRAELCAALAWDAARAVDAGEQHALAAAVAGARVLDAAVENAKDCVQVLGGIGFTWEHDAHFYLRRAMTLRQLLGGGTRWRHRAAELALAGSRRWLDVDLGEQHDDEVRATATELAALSPERQRIRLAETGFLTPHWPRPYGLDASAARQLVIDAELARAGVRRPDLVIGAWAAPTILQHGTPGQQERFVGPTLRGEITWCQLFSEPGAGSDLASLRTKASRVDGGWLITGQKVWTSGARQADWAICLARTDLDARKHKGITYFLVDMRAEGIDIRPLREITGDEMFNEVFLEDVFVPDADVVGEVNGGWKLARTTLANERVAMSGSSSMGEDTENLLGAVRAHGLAEDPAVLDRLGALIADGSAGSLLDLRATLKRLAGQDPGPESSVRKLIGVRHRQDLAEAALELHGPGGIVVTEESAKDQHEFLMTRCLSIAGGTTQILRTVAAERLLGLPRDT